MLNVNGENDDDNKHTASQSSSSLSSLPLQLYYLLRDEIYLCHCYSIRVFGRFCVCTLCGRAFLFIYLSMMHVALYAYYHHLHLSTITITTTTTTTITIIILTTTTIMALILIPSSPLSSTIGRITKTSHRLTGVYELIDTETFGDDDSVEYRENLRDMNTLSVMTGAFHCHMDSPLVGMGRFMSRSMSMSMGRSVGRSVESVGNKSASASDTDQSLLSILDVGCGNGTLCIQLYEWWMRCHSGSRRSGQRRQYNRLSITGVDMSHTAIHLANEQLCLYATTTKEKRKKNDDDDESDDNNDIKSVVSFKRTEQAQLNEPPKSYDIVTCSLMTHHIPTDDDIVDFLRRAGQVARKAIVINDLERDALAVLAYRYIITPMFENRLTRHDGLMSIQRSFTEREWHRYLTAAGYNEKQFRINWCPVSRFIIYIDLTM